MDPKFIGRTIDSYQILDVLGKGGMGIVYRARDLMLDKDVAVKMVDAPLDPEGRLLKRLQEEARALARLQHPNIVGIYALRESQLGLCIVMEMVKGRTLSEIIKDAGPLPPQRVRAIFLQCLNALAHAHKEGIIHRDIKPGNIMLTGDDTVKITDFGLAKRADPAGNASTVLAAGTLYYSPPEQLDSLSDVDERGDIYSLGMTMYEALTGRVPFAETSSDFRIREAIVEGRIPPPDKMKPGLPHDLVQVVMKAIQRDPTKRFHSAGAMLEALQNSSVTDAPVNHRPSLPVRPIAIGLLVVAVGVLAWLFLPFGSSERSVTGTVTVMVREPSGTPVPNATVLIGPITGAVNEKVEISDLRNDQSTTGGLTTTTNFMGESSLRYSGTPEARLQVAVEMENYSQGIQTFTIPRDSVVVIISRRTGGTQAAAGEGGQEPAEASPGAGLLVSLLDESNNPVPSALISIQGRSGKELTARTDLQGRAQFNTYSVSTDGSTPAVRIAVDHLKAYTQLSKAKKKSLPDDMALNLNINEFIPYDRTLRDLQRGAEALRTDARRLKDRVPGSEGEKRTDSDYRRGLENETFGERQLADRNFEEALGSFSRAKDYFARSAATLTGRKSGGAAGSGTPSGRQTAPDQADATPEEPGQPAGETGKTSGTETPGRESPARETAGGSGSAEPARPDPRTVSPPADSRETSRKDLPKTSIAPPNVHSILDQYKKSFEHADLTGLSRLMGFSKREQSTWSTFFDVAENIVVTTGGEHLQSENANANVRFDVTISYRDKLDGEQKKIEGAVSLGMRYTDGQWETVSHQFKQ